MADARSVKHLVNQPAKPPVGLQTKNVKIPIIKTFF